ncbi:unnamed protein product [Heligmosomoides polygyrus]|uniref:NADH dehydrogenase [ubiquinone] 1 beta subcomplex subunit 9 n=1 Tax=Heligmosomoides polygyrus TaxID=6339 RepID=A0A183FDD5_HELPZ|nr:unnamed protein product [Heligmosomoides polygyrus]
MTPSGPALYDLRDDKYGERCELDQQQANRPDFFWLHYLQRLSHQKVIEWSRMQPEPPEKDVKGIRP